MGYYSDDPVADFAAFDAEQARREKDCPVCADCEEPIQDEHYCEYDGKCYCQQCHEIYHTKRKDGYYG